MKLVFFERALFWTGVWWWLIHSIGWHYTLSSCLLMQLLLLQFVLLVIVMESLDFYVYAYILVQIVETNDFACPVNSGKYRCTCIFNQFGILTWFRFLNINFDSSRFYSHIHSFRLLYRKHYLNIFNTLHWTQMLEQLRSQCQIQYWLCGHHI